MNEDPMTPTPAPEPPPGYRLLTDEEKKQPLPMDAICSGSLGLKWYDAIDARGCITNTPERQYATRLPVEPSPAPTPRVEELERELSLSQSQSRDREHQWMFGVSVQALLLSIPDSVNREETMLDALRRTFSELTQLRAENAQLVRERDEARAEEQARLASDPAEVLLIESQQRELRLLEQLATLRTAALKQLSPQDNLKTT